MIYFTFVEFLNLEMVNAEYMNSIIKVVYDFKDASSKKGF